jgi:hypothetical protein
MVGLQYKEKERRLPPMATVIDKTNEHYWIWDISHICCDEIQFKYQCRYCEEMMGCYFCEFDYSEPCDCQSDMVGSILFTTKEGK